MTSADNPGPSLSPLTGAAAEAMAAATSRAERATANLRAARGPDQVTREALDHVAGMFGAYRAGRTYACQDGKSYSALYPVARLTVALRDLRVRDDAWARILPGSKDDLRMWTDVTRLARPGYAAAPAFLLAVTAWQAGNRPLTADALTRALDDTPRYSAAVVLRDAIEAGMSPEQTRTPLTPAQVTADYDAHAKGDASYWIDSGTRAAGPGEGAPSTAVAGTGTRPGADASSVPTGPADTPGQAPGTSPWPAELEGEIATQWRTDAQAAAVGRAGGRLPARPAARQLGRSAAGPRRRGMC